MIMPSFIASAGSVDDEIGALESLWQNVSRDATWRAPGVNERRRLRDGLRCLLLAAPTCDVGKADLDPYFENTPFEVTVLAEHSLWVVQERSGAHAGGGLYAVRCGPNATPWVLQAPHSFHDGKTRSIVQHLFAHAGARAAYFNTVHRYRSRANETQADLVHPADVAHQYGSFFQAATLAAAASDASLMFIQVHGFSARPELPWDVIVSSGRPDTPPKALAHRLLPSFDRVVAFDGTAGRLGATTNVQGLALNRHGAARFVHLELGETVRQGFGTERADALIAALKEPWW
jgi:hypothetical protein